MIATGKWSTGIFEAKSTDTPMVIYPRAGRTGVSDPDGEIMLNTITISRWPSGTTGATGSDGHADIVDAANNKVYSIWQLAKDTSGRWSADTVGRSALNGSGWAILPLSARRARRRRSDVCGHDPHRRNQ